jgi:hypothetical protein
LDRNLGGGRLPDFLGVGQPRTATSWLDTVLRGHVGLPRDVKEVDFFVKHYDRGIEWYMQYFADCDRRLPCGEICPSYLGSREALERIARHLPDCRIICTFRDPVHALFSFWKLARRNAWTTAPFESYQVPGHWRAPAVVLRDWRAAFGTNHVLAMIYDDLLADPQDYLDQVCAFIGIDRVVLAGQGIARERVNSFARLPRSHYLARKGRKLRDWLQHHERYGTVNLFSQLGVWRFCFEGGTPFPPLDPAAEQRMRRRMMPEIEALETALGRDLSRWKSSALRSPDQTLGWAAGVG